MARAPWIVRIGYNIIKLGFVVAVIALGWQRVVKPMTDQFNTIDGKWTPEYSQVNSKLYPTDRPATGGDVNN